MRRSMARGIVVLAVVLLGGMVSPVESAPIRSFEFSGIVDVVVGTPFGLTVNFGDPILGTLTYDAGVPGIARFGGDAGTFAHYYQSIVSGITALVGGRAYSTNDFAVVVGDNRKELDGTMLDGYNAASTFGFPIAGVLFEGGNPVNGDISVSRLMHRT